jgi:hypothetical protein
VTIGVNSLSEVGGCWSVGGSTLDRDELVACLYGTTSSLGVETSQLL